MRKLLISLVACVALAGETDMDTRLDSFNRHWTRFNLDYFGCRTGPVDCREGFQQFNYHEWNASREAAKKLFDLEDKR